MKNVTHRLISSFAFVSLGLLVAGSPPVSASAEFTMLVPPVKEGGVRAVHEFYGADGVLNLAYEQAYPDRPSEFFHLRYLNGNWSSPRLIPVSHPNARTLRDVVTMSDGTPMLLMSSDDTDYARVFNLSGQPTIDENGVPMGTGLSAERFRQVLAENQRLFYSLQVGGSWTPPLLIPDSALASQSVLAAGDDGSVLVVFVRDGDKRPDTLTDNELYAAVYQNHVWSRPVRLTFNTMVEHSLRAQYANGQYLVVWVTDRDGELRDRADSTLDYAVVSRYGTVARQAASVVAGPQNNPAPVLGRDGSEAVLLWTSDPGPENQERGMWEARFGGAWSSPIDTGLRADYLLGGSVQKRAEGLLLTFKDKGFVNAALKANGKWSAPIPIKSFNGPLQYGEYRLFADHESRLWVAAAASVAGAAGETADYGLYVWQQMLVQDLAIQVTGEKPLRKQLGREATLAWKVVNRGVLPSAAYRSEVSRNDKTEKVLEGRALAPGESQEFEYAFVVNEAQTPLELRVVAPGDGRQENNRLTHVLEVLPDFEVRSVRRVDPTHYTAEIVERKGIAAPPVKAAFYLLEDSQQYLVAEGEFDPSSGVPLTVQTDALLDKTGPYQVLVRVNMDRKVKEDNYSNNQSAYNHRLQADFEITQLYLTADYVYLGVRNSGNQPAASVEILLTDDPLLAGSAAPGGEPWYYQSLPLDEAGQAQLEVPRAGRPALERESLYAVVNPYGTVPESDRNNNTRKISLTRPASTVPGGGSGGGDGGPALMEPALEFAKAVPWCSNLQIDVSNTGGEAAVGSRLELVNAAGFIVAVEALPVVMPTAIQSVTFQGLGAGAYTLRLVYRLADGTDRIVTRQAVITDSDYCRTIAGNDVRVIDVRIEPRDEFIRVAVSVGAVGYELDYRKPLLRVPVELEVKQDIRSLYGERQDVYLAGGEDEHVAQAVFDIARASLPGGRLQFTARVPVRDDETKAANNLRVMEYSVGE